jgi:hypothetical protein
MHVEGAQLASYLIELIEQCRVAEVLARLCLIIDNLQLATARSSPAFSGAVLGVLGLGEKC